MAWQLVYTSASRLLDAGRTGFGTVARHRQIGASLAAAVERSSQFNRVAGFDDARIIYAHRHIVLGGSRFHVLSRIRATSADYTGRTNHIAHHVVAEPREIAALRAGGPTPVDLLLSMEWLDRWDEPPRYLEEGVVALEAASRHLALPAQGWEALAGDRRRAALLASPEALRGCYLAWPNDPREDALQQWPLRLFGESLLLRPERAWDVTFTTHLQPSDESGDFQWRGIAADSPLRSQAAQSGRLYFDLADPATLPIPAGELADLAANGVRARRPASTPVSQPAASANRNAPFAATPAARTATAGQRDSAWDEFKEAGAGRTKSSLNRWILVAGIAAVLGLVAGASLSWRINADREERDNIAGQLAGQPVKPPLSPQQFQEENNGAKTDAQKSSSPTIEGQSNARNALDKTEGSTEAGEKEMRDKKDRPLTLIKLAPAPQPPRKAPATTSPVPTYVLLGDANLPEVLLPSIVLGAKDEHELPIGYVTPKESTTLRRSENTVRLTNHMNDGPAFEISGNNLKPEKGSNALGKRYTLRIKESASPFDILVLNETIGDKFTPIFGDLKASLVRQSTQNSPAGESHLVFSLSNESTLMIKSLKLLKNRQKLKIAIPGTIQPLYLDFLQDYSIDFGDRLKELQRRIDYLRTQITNKNRSIQDTEKAIRDVSEKAKEIIPKFGTLLAKDASFPNKSGTLCDPKDYHSLSSFGDYLDRLLLEDIERSVTSDAFKKAIAEGRKKIECNKSDQASFEREVKKIPDILKQLSGPTGIIAKVKEQKSMVAADRALLQKIHANWESLLSGHPGHSISDLIQLKEFEEKKNFEKAKNLEGKKRDEAEIKRIEENPLMQGNPPTGSYQVVIEDSTGNAPVYIPLMKFDESSQASTAK